MGRFAGSGKRSFIGNPFSQMPSPWPATRCRARTNIETLIVRLDEIGYRFETARDTSPAVVQQMVQVQRAMAQQLEAQYPVLLANLSRGNRFEEFVSAFDKRLAPTSTLDERST